MKYIRQFFLLAAAAAFSLFGCGGSSRSAAPAGLSSRKIEVTATLFPLYDFARQVGGGEVEVSLLLPPGVEAHSYEPKPGDVIRVSKARVFLFTGHAMEPWAADFLAGIKNPALVVAEAGKGIALLEDSHDEEEEEEEEEHAGGGDPHIWLDLANAAAMVDTVAEALERAAPEKREIFQANARAYKEKLLELDKRILEEARGFRSKTIPYGGHFAFGYFVKRYGLEHISPYPGFSPNAEPTPQRIVRLAAKMRELGLTAIFHEELVEPRVAEAVARETGAKLLLLHGGHNLSKNELESGVTFLEIMEKNLENLRIGLR